MYPYILSCRFVQSGCIRFIVTCCFDWPRSGKSWLNIGSCKCFLNISLCCIQVFFKLPQTGKRTNMAFVSEWMTNKANSCWQSKELGFLSQTRHVSSTPISKLRSRDIYDTLSVSHSGWGGCSPHTATRRPPAGLRAGVLPAVAGHAPARWASARQPAAPVQAHLMTHSNLHVAFLLFLFKENVTKKTIHTKGLQYWNTDWKALTYKVAHVMKQISNC